MTLGSWNALSPAEAASAILPCTGSTRWAVRVAFDRPYPHGAALFEATHRTWWDLDPNDWLEAFASHPRIGERASKRACPQSRIWSIQEQADVETDDAIAERLAEGNRHYEARFGHVYLVCASGKTASEMLDILESRLRNAPDHELRVAASEGAKIMELRLWKWLDA